jgi:hypothetical protein
MKVYELVRDHQIEPENYGLFSTKDKAVNFLEEYLNVDTSIVVEYHQWGKTVIGEYKIVERQVA